MTAAPGAAPIAPPPSPPKPAAALGQGTRLGKYLILGILGHGGMGNVYAAEDTLIKRRVAIKVLPPEVARDKSLTDRLLAEARSAGNLNHPNVVTIYDVLQTAGTYAIVMELVPGGSVQDYLQRKGSPGWRAATRLIAEAAKALSAAHDAGLVHRDIKPANLLLTNDGHVKVSDFGLAKIENKDATMATQAGAILGTPAFMSPEQCRGEKLDARADLYSLGATYFALLTGKPPFEAPSSIQVMFAHCSSPVPDPRDLGSDVPDDVVAVLHRLLAKNAADRYGTAKELLADLRMVLGGSTSAPSPLASLEAVAARVEDLPSAPVVEYGRPRKRFSTQQLVLASVALGVVVIAVAIPLITRARETANRVEVSSNLAQVGKALLLYSNENKGSFPRSKAPQAVDEPATSAGLPTSESGTKPPPVAAVVPAPPEQQTATNGRGFVEAPNPVAVVPTPPAPGEASPSVEPPPQPSPAPEPVPAKPSEPVKPPEREITNALGMKLVWIEPGKFNMGAAGLPDARPREVTLTRGYYLGVHEVTQGQWTQIMRGPAMKEELPFAHASYEEAAEFCRRLSDRPEEKAAGRRYRLPTEAEWEYACRAGNQGRFSTGETLPKDQANYGKTISLEQLKKLEGGQGDRPEPPQRPDPPQRPGPGGRRPREAASNPPQPGGMPDRAQRPLEPAGSFPANRWGLYDMHGSVWEWVADFYEPYKPGDVTDPTGPETGKVHVLRGGAWNSPAEQCASAYRNGRGIVGDGKLPLYGFRVVCEVAAP